MKQDKADKAADDHKFQVHIPRKLWAKYKADCALRGVSVRSDILAHIESRVGEPAKKPKP